MAKRVGVLCGGYSSEREVSFRSGRNVERALKASGIEAFCLDPVYDDVLSQSMDCAFIALHGPYGEDGVLQALLNSANIPYTGSGVQASVMCMNKLVTKALLVQHKFPTPIYQVVSRYKRGGGEGEFWSRHGGGPVIVKPMDEGSSVGIEIVDILSNLDDRVGVLVDHYGQCLIEKYIEGTELTVGVLESDSGPEALPVLEVRSQNRFYDYEAKYTKGKTALICPAEISDEVRDRCQRLAVEAYQLFGCRGACRVDMMLDGEHPTILELNTVPGMTDLSDLPMQAREAGYSFEELVLRLLDKARCDAC